MHAAIRLPPYVGGWRYSDLRSFLSCPVIGACGGLDAYLRTLPPRARVPRGDFLPDPSSFAVARAPLLRMLAKRVLGDAGYAVTTFAGSLRALAGDGVLVDLDVGMRMVQFRWCAAVGATVPTHPDVELPCSSFERLRGCLGHWDYLTEENAERSFALLPTLVRESVRWRGLGR